jgi:hypothetical protein
MWPWGLLASARESPAGIIEDGPEMPVHRRGALMGQSPHFSWFPFYWQDFLGSDKVQNMTDEEVGIYLKLLIRQWDKGSVPDKSILFGDIPYLKSNSLDTILKVRSLCFHKRNNCWVNMKMVQVKKARVAHYQRLKSLGAKGGRAKAKLASDATPEPSNFSGYPYPYPKPHKEKESPLRVPPFRSKITKPAETPGHDRTPKPDAAYVDFVPTSSLVADMLADIAKRRTESQT